MVAPAEPTVRLLACLRRRLVARAAAGEGPAGGALYGAEVSGQLLVLGAAGRGGAGTGGLELCNEMLPCGVEPVGVWGVGGAGVAGLASLAAQLPALTQGTGRPLLLAVSGEGEVEAALQGEGGPGPILQPEQVTAEEVAALVTLVRVRGYVEVNCGLTQPEVSNAFKHLIEKVSCPYGSFMLEGGRLALLHKFVERGPGRGWTVAAGGREEEEDCLIAGLAEGHEPTVGDLWDYTRAEQESDGFGTGGGGQAKVAPRDRLELRLAWNYSNPACSSRTIGCAPILHREKKAGATVRIPLPLDALGIVATSAPATQLMEVLKGAVGRQVGDMAAAVLSELKSTGSVSAPRAFHFRPPGLGHHVSLVYCKSATNATFEQFRRSVHSSFLLPADRPLFRRANALTFLEPGDPGRKLSSVHRGVEARHGLPGSAVTVALVQGDYAYHHYMQDNFDDDGWGCAYRSLQTLVSWLRAQGYTETDVPSHRQVQKCLVDIGDKEAKFIGSKQWIGSTEVGFVLETACGVQSRFVSVSEGSDLPSKARELVLHFQGQGSPVMIGGGVYAHTILGVAWDEGTGDAAWLVLDPHYTGQDDLKTIQGKGWCAWKGPKFWNQTAFYNMCLPQRPSDTV